ncbi:hypothetical protein D9619_012801 [Psilocybe cf. subviscida]|uniref:Peptidase metallopeptidase domain-containing protein n=1 Tax=Psilocybe cf. subviscida TaxID=2480587 RepID=A0A8H5AQL6_9AGAR|nr:hypothetical protein D9619_012801 [Psilocybe cf. subviscida]
MTFFPASEAIDGTAAILDHPEAGAESSLVPQDPLEEWVWRTCVDVPPDVEEEAEEGEEEKGHAVVTEPDNLWENGKTITYSFLGPAPLSGTPRQQKKVIKVLTSTPSTWKDYANIKFKLLPSSLPASQAIVRIQFIKGTASWAHIGRKCQYIDPSLPTMNLGWIADSDNLSDTDRAVVLHEFGHVLGLLHEHQSPAIGGVITLKAQQVKEVFKRTKGWSEKQVEEQILRPYQSSELTNFTEFDSNSIMMYYMPREMNDQDIDIAPNDALSKFDKAFVAVHYPFFGPKAPAKPDARIENALRVLGIAPDEDEAGEGETLLPLDDETPEPTEEEKAEMQRLAEERQKKLEDKERIMRLYRKGDWMEIREAVREIYASVREERMKGVAERLRALAKKPVMK